MLKLPVFGKCPLAIAVDLDGTLFDSRSELSDRSRMAIEKCLQRGIPFIVVTARPERSVRQKLGEDLASKCTLITMHGVVSRMATPFQLVQKSQLPADVSPEIIQMAEKSCPAAHIILEMEGFEYARNRRAELSNQSPLPEALNNLLMPLAEALKRPLGGIFVVDFNSDLGGLADDIEKQFQGTIAVIRSNQNHVLSVVKKGVSKINGLKWIMDKYQIDLASVAAFGDDLPDMEMLSICGFSVAMENALPEVKAASKYQTLSNDADGVAVMVERMLGTKKMITGRDALVTETRGR